MKKTLLIISAFLVCLSFVGCGSESESSSRSMTMKTPSYVAESQADSATSDVSVSESQGTYSSENIKEIFSGVMPDLKRTELFVGGCVSTSSSAQPYVLPADDLTGSGNTVDVTYIPIEDSEIKTEADLKNFFLQVFTESYLKETYYYLFQDSQKEYCTVNAVNGYVPDKVKSLYIDNSEGKLCIEQAMVISGESYIEWNTDTISEVRERDNQVSFLIDGISTGGTASAETIPGNFLLENTEGGWRVAGYSANYYDIGNVFLG